MTNGRSTAEVFLVPGFLGFEALGKLDYFIDVESILARKLGELGVAARVHVTDTVPAGSLRKRAAKLASEIADKHDVDASSVHVIGHSTGGLDARLLLSPGSVLDVNGHETLAMDRPRIASYRDALSKIRTAVGVATPHFGAPIADRLVRVSFDEVLRHVGSIASTRPVRTLAPAALKSIGGFAKFLRDHDPDHSFFEWVVPDVLWDDPDSVIEYFVASSVDVGALRNLTQEGTDLANAAIHDRAGVRYASVVTGTRPPAGPIRTSDPLLYVNTVCYRAARRIGAHFDPAYPYSGRVDELRRVLAADREARLPVGELRVDTTTNDGVVPSASQAYGTLLGVFASDHLDCIGHFPHLDVNREEIIGWIHSGAAFDDERFDLLWGRVAGFIAQSAEPDRAVA